MIPPLRFRMKDRDDLSKRSDFTFEVMQALTKDLEAAVAALPVVAELRGKASVTVRARGSLRNVALDVQVTPTTDEGLTADETEAIRAAVGEAIRREVPQRMAGVLQRSTRAARER